MRPRRLNLLQKFSLLSFVSVLIFCVALGFLTSHVLTRNMLESEWHGTAELVRYQVRAYALERLFTDLHLRAKPQQYAEALGSLLNLPEVVRVKVWDRDGTVIWATDARIIGKRFAGNAELQEALRGRVSAELKPLTKAEHLYERERLAKLAEVYVPIFSADRPDEAIGVLEIYKVPARLFAAIRRVNAAVWGASLGGAVLLYLSLFWIVRIAYRSQLGLERTLTERSEELKDRNATLEFFLQTISHDLRASAVAIHGLSGTVFETCAESLPAEARRLLRRVQENAEHQDQLLADLVTLSRIGTDPSVPQEVDVSVLVREVVGDTCEALGAGPVKATIDGSLPTLRCDRDELREVFRNLVSNAVKFTGDRDPEIRIAAQDRDQWVEFSVEDNGIGIDSAYHAKIFEAFERLNEIPAEGTGVGLTIGKKIVEGVGGRVCVESAKGHGATFRFTVPKVWPVKRGAKP